MYTLYVVVHEGGKTRRPHAYEHSGWNLRAVVLQELYKQGNDAFRTWLRSHEAYLETTSTGYSILNLTAEFVKPFVRHQARWMVGRLSKWRSFFAGRPIEQHAQVDLIFLVD
jgi:hypothetical protein